MQPQGLVAMILPAHILAGVLALVFGYFALYATKGARLHRRWPEYVSSHSASRA